MNRKQITLIIIVSFISSLIYSQNATICNINSNNVAIEGYDLVSYFTNKAKKGKSKYTYIHKGINYYFSSTENMNTFKATPSKYLPQYGGWCAYAMGKKGKKVNMDPKNFEIRDDKLYLFYKSFFVNTYENWLKENPELLKEKANKNWNVMQTK